MDAQPLNINRDDLAKFIKDPRTLRAFENLASNQGASIDVVTALSEAPVIGASTVPVFSNDRFLNGSSDILLTDGGPKGPMTLGLTPTGVSAGNYGSPSQLIGLAIDGKGRITLGAQYALVSDNVAEGSSNLFFTTARARASLSGSSAISYDSATGVFSLVSTAVVPATYGSATSVPTFTVDAKGRLTAASGNSIPALASGSYTPTVIAGANVAAASGAPCTYVRIGDIVYVTGKVDVQATVTAASTVVGIPLPIPSNIVTPTDLNGSTASAGVLQAGGIEGDISNDRAALRFIAQDTASRGMFFTFSYVVAP